MTKKLALTVLAVIGVAAIGVSAWQWRSAFGVNGDPSAAGNRRAFATAGQTTRSEVTVDARRQQLIGVRTVRAYRTNMAPEIRTVGTVTYDETRQAEINTRLEGWIRDLYADYTGRPIRRGEPLFTLYSPDLIATENEYLLAVRGQSHSEHESPNLRQYSERLVDAARERLLRLEMTPAEIEQLERTGRALETLTFRSSADGIIVEKAAVRGMRVMPGQMLYRVTDLSTVWVDTEIFQTDLARVRLGTRAEVSVPAYPDRTFRGRVSYVYPTVNEQTRTARVRVVLANPGQTLKPNMFTTVVLQPPAVRVLVLPADAVVNTGNRQVVFVAEGDGRFTPRDVYVGRRGDGEVEVLSGIKDGEEVAAGATFFLDSESQLRNALRNYEPTDTAVPAASAQTVDVRLRTEPDPPRVGEDTLIVTVKDATGHPITDADVSVALFMPTMPSMNMPAMRHEARLLSVGAGVYRGKGEVMTPGRWDVTVTVSKSGKPVGVKQLALVAK